MTNKTTKAYSEVFKYIDKNIFKLKPNLIMTDFEKGMRKAINRFFTKVKLHGCWFHYDQAIQRYDSFNFSFYKLEIVTTVKTESHWRVIRVLHDYDEQKDRRFHTTDMTLNFEKRSLNFGDNFTFVHHLVFNFCHRFLLLLLEGIVDSVQS